MKKKLSFPEKLARTRANMVPVEPKRDIFLSVYGGSYDGKTRVIVGAKSKKAAYEAMNAVLWGIDSYSTWNQYTAETFNEIELELGQTNPGVVYACTTNWTQSKDDYIPVNTIKDY